VNKLKGIKEHIELIFVRSEDIKEHCLDKQKIKTAINKRMDHFEIWKKERCGDNKTEAIKLSAVIRVLEELKEGLGL